jgi:hypothetical protein
VDPDTSGRARLARRGWEGFQRLTQIGFPRQFQIVQFPNLPLLVAFGADAVHHFVAGATGRYVQAVGYVALAIWAYEELVHGSNWFRRLLGATFIVITVMRVARHLHG